MAEGKQHYIPRFLLKGFASKISTKGSRTYAQTYVYTKQSIYQSNIDDIASEKKYYDDINCCGVDDMLGDVEQVFAPWVNSLRNGICDDVDSATASDFMLHLSIRSKCIRSVFSDASEQMLTLFFKKICDPDFAHYIIDILIQRIATDDALCMRYIRSGVGPRAIPPESIWSVVESFRSIIVRDRSIMAKDFVKNCHCLSEALTNQESKTKIINSIKAAHVQYMKACLDRKAVRRTFDSMRYQLIHFSDTPIIMGDSVTVFHHFDGKTCGIIDGNGDNCDYVIIPIASNIAIIGYRGELRQFNYSDIVGIIIGCSYELFVSPTRDELYSINANNIGKHVSPLDANDMEMIVNKCMVDLIADNNLLHF